MSFVSDMKGEGVVINLSDKIERKSDENCVEDKEKQRIGTAKNEESEK